MGTQSIPTSLAPEVIIAQVSGDLYVKGWDRPEVTVMARQGDLTLEKQNDEVHLSCRSNCDIRLPHGTTLKVNEVDGNAQLKLLEERLMVGEVRGSLAIRDVVSAQVETVHGNVSVKGVSGDFEARQIKGNAEVRKIQRNCYLEEVQGNLDGWDVEGEVRMHVRGNVYLHLSVMSGADYRIHSDGNVHCYLPEDASLKLSLSSQGEMIKVRLAGQSSTIHQAQYELTLNGGEASLEVSAAGSIHLFSKQPEWGEVDETDFEADLGSKPEEFSHQVAQQVEAQIQAQLEMVTHQMNEEVARISERLSSSGLSPEEIERIVEQARQTSERKSARVQEKLQRAQEKMERKLEAALRRHERRAEEFDRRTRYGKHAWSFQWPTPSMSITPSQPPEKEAVTEEERLMVLRMLEQKKITPEEADRLLAALEGREG